MAEAAVCFAVERPGELLIAEASLLNGLTDKVAEIQVELRRMKCFLKDAEARKDENETIRNWVAEIRENALDAEDIIETFALRRRRRRRRRRGCVRNILKRPYACTFCDLIATCKVGKEIDAIKTRISSLTTSLETYNINVLLCLSAPSVSPQKQSWFPLQMGGTPSLEKRKSNLTLIYSIINLLTQ